MQASGHGPAVVNSTASACPLLDLHDIEPWRERWTATNLTQLLFSGYTLRFLIGWGHTHTLDQAGADAQEFSEILRFIQLVDFPTRDGNALDLVFTDVVGNHSARPVPGLGSSDHLALRISLDMKSTIPDPVSRAPVRMWCAAPWGNIGGELHKALKHWDPDAFGCVDNAVQDLI